MARSKAPSNAVTKAAAVGTPWSILTAFATFKLAAKYALPVEVASAAVGMIITGIQSAAQYFARGGRKGEAE